VTEFLETTVDKFTFKVATDRLYTDSHLWVKREEGLACIGLSDYLQQRSGDVAFTEVEPEGTQLAASDDLASIETIKVNLALPSPVSGVIREVNRLLEEAPELVNQDPYGEGWLALVEATDWQADKANLLDPQTYFQRMKAEAEEESRKL
jgi:glycine cleavage system H protein